MQQPKYREQFERTKRWFQRFQELATGKGHTLSSDYYQDEVYAFFLNCYHLKDWIKNDPFSGVLSQTVEDYVTKSEALSLCADICNGLKHLTVTRPRSKKDPQFGKSLFKLGVGQEPTTIAVEYTITTNSGDIDAFKLAEECMEAWKNFLK